VLANLLSDSGSKAEKLKPSKCFLLSVNNGHSTLRDDRAKHSRDEHTSASP
jgi:hypothetical protein